MLHYLYPLKEVFTMRTTKKTILTSKWENHCVPCICEILCNMRKLLTLNYCTLFVWTSMVLLVHKKSKSTNEFTMFWNELGEFLTKWSTTSWYGQVNSLTYEQLRNFEYFNYLILMI
jgi:hypothetical protein